MAGLLFPPANSVLDGVFVTGTPSAGQLLTATSATAANWQSPNVIDGVTVSGAAATGKVITATGATTANWQTPLAIDSTATDIAGLGNQAAGSTGLLADAGHVHPGSFWLPSDNQLLAANDDIGAAVGASVAINKTDVTLMKVYIRQPITATNILLLLASAGSGASTGTFVGLYNSAGTLLSGSADQAANFTQAAPSISTCPLSTPQSLSGGTFVWVAVLTNLATTQPSFGRMGGTGSVTFMNLGLSAATLRFAANGTGVTALPSTITPASNTPTNAFTFWVGIT